jgi:hypothetical protein
MSVRNEWMRGLGLCALLAIAAAGTASAQVAVSQSNLKKSFDCGGKEATIVGSQNELTLTGECPTLTVKGSQNTISVEAVGTIRVVGTMNKVTWQRSTIDKGPKITRSGLDNVITQATSLLPSGDPAPAAASKAAPAAKAAKSPASSAAPASSKGSSSSSSAPPVVVSDEKATRTIDCRGRGVSVMGNGNTLTLRGTCRKVDVKGNDNIISVEAVQAIATTGNHNRVTWNRATEGESPSTSDLGNGNAIQRATAPLP